jgi:hypothetical protein
MPRPEADTDQLRTWKRTVIGGETIPCDFVAEAEGEIIGRLMNISGGPQNGKWQWSFLLGHSDFRRGNVSGVEESKQQAVDETKAAFERYLEYPADKGGGAGLPPDNWRPGTNAYAKAKGL